MFSTNIWVYYYLQATVVYKHTNDSLDTKTSSLYKQDIYKILEMYKYKSSFNLTSTGFSDKISSVIM